MRNGHKCTGHVFNTALAHNVNTFFFLVITDNLSEVAMVTSVTAATVRLFKNWCCCTVYEVIFTNCQSSVLYCSHQYYYGLELSTGARCGPWTRFRRLGSCDVGLLPLKKHFNFIIDTLGNSEFGVKLT